MARIDGDAGAGQACTVTSGSNAGKKGTITVDPDGTVWCEGSWGATQCSPGKCTTTKVDPIRVFEYVDSVGQLLYEVEGTVEVDGGRIFESRATIDADTLTSRSVVVDPIAASPLADLQKSETEVILVFADLIDSQLH